MLITSLATVLSLTTLTHLPSVGAQLGVPVPVAAIGQPCDIERNRLTSTTHQFLSGCERKGFCDPVERICKPKGCRSEEFPFGFRPEDTLPPFCSEGQFCPDEEDMCLPIVPVGGDCQMNRDGE
jgi:hypothetical protein